MRIPSADARNSLAQLVQKYHEQAAGVGTYLAARGINSRAVEKYQLGFTGDNGDYKTQNRLTIPYLSPAGPWHIKYRCVSCTGKCEGHPKYIYDEGSDQHLYNAQTLLNADRVVVVEGELDAISVEMAGIPAVGFPGADTWKKNPFWRWCFDSVDSITIVADGDEPREGKKVGVGEEAAITVAGSLRQALPDMDVRVVVMPTGHDSNSFINEFGEVEYLETIGAI